MIKAWKQLLLEDLEDESLSRHLNEDMGFKEGDSIVEIEIRSGAKMAINISRAPYHFATGDFEKFDILEKIHKEFKLAKRKTPHHSIVPEINLIMEKVSLIVSTPFFKTSGSPMFSGPFTSGNKKMTFVSTKSTKGELWLIIENGVPVKLMDNKGKARRAHMAINKMVYASCETLTLLNNIQGVASIDSKFCILYDSSLNKVKLTYNKSVAEMTYFKKGEDVE